MLRLNKKGINGSNNITNISRHPAVSNIQNEKGIGMSDIVDQMEQQGRFDPNVHRPSTVSYHSKLVGVTFEGRQEVISTLGGKEPLRVRREKDNKYDPKAVAVDVYKNDEWLPIGYIAKDKTKISAKH